MVTLNERDDADDALLRAAFRRAASPATPDLTSRVQRRIARQRANTRWIATSAVAAVLLIAGLLAWRPSPPPEESLAVLPVDRSSATVADETPELSLLRQQPPVDSLDVLDRQQAAYVAALEQML